MSGSIYHDYVRGRAEAHLAKRRQRLTAISSAEDVARRAAEVRVVCARILGPFPERTPLQAKVVQVSDDEIYRVEMLTYQSRPDFFVTANLYLPKSGQPPFPAVLCLVGHWEEGKAHGDHQRLGRLLAAQGIAALLIDSIGQGERVQLFDVTLRHSWIGRSVELEHAHLGNLFFLVGQHPANWMVWDAIRGLDLLAEHPALDPTRLGACGACCGATLIRYLCALEGRLAAAACILEPGQLAPLGGGDAEQNLFDALAQGVAPVDLLGAFAPRPLLLGQVPGQVPEAERGSSGVLELHLRELETLYQKAGLPSRLVPVALEGQLGFPQSVRVRTVEFFARTFGVPVKVRDHAGPVKAPELLWCTETGQIRTALNVADWPSALQEAVRDLPPAFPVPRGSAEVGAFRERMGERIRALLRMPEAVPEVEQEVEGHSSDWGLRVEKGRIIVEPGIYIPYSHYTTPDAQSGNGPRPTVLALHERGVHAIAAQGLWMRRMAGGGHDILTIDVRGIGETHLQSSGSVSDPYAALLLGTEAQWVRRALNAGLNLFGGRVFDVLQTLAFLRKRLGVRPGQLSVVGVGRGALWALYAAALDPQVARVVLIRGLTDYRSLMLGTRHNHHFSLYLPGVLREFDLPQVAACIAPRPLLLLNPVQQRRERLRRSAAERIYAFTDAVYEGLGERNAFRVLTADSIPETLHALADGLGFQPEQGGWEQWVD